MHYVSKIYCTRSLVDITVNSEKHSSYFHQVYKRIFFFLPLSAFCQFLPWIEYHGFTFSEVFFILHYHALCPGSLTWMEYINVSFALGILDGWNSDSGEEAGERVVVSNLFLWSSPYEGTISWSHPSTKGHSFWKSALFPVFHNLLVCSAVCLRSSTLYLVQWYSTFPVVFLYPECFLLIYITLPKLSIYFVCFFLGMWQGQFTIPDND